VRPNAALEDFFSGVATGASEATKQIEGLKKQLDAMRASAGLRGPSVGMDMNALARSSRNPSNVNFGVLGQYSGGIGRQLPDMARQQTYSRSFNEIAERGDKASATSYDMGFQNRYLTREIKSGDMERRIKATLQAEEAAKRLSRQNQILIGQVALMERQARYGRIGGALANVYANNREGFNQLGGMAGRAGMGVGMGIAGLTASGYSGTIEGERFARELRVLSLELAAAFKPLMDAATGATQYVRKKMQSLTREDQDMVMRVGTAAAGAYVGSRIGGVFGGRGRAIGALAGGELGYRSPETIEAIKKGEGAIGGVYNFMNGDLGKRLTDAVSEAMDMNPFSRVYSSFKNLRKSIADNAGTESETGGLGQLAASALGGKLANNSADPNRRQLMLTEGTGFADAGSTFFALQEDLIRTQAAEQNEKIVNKLDEVKNEVAKLNK
jgi:hypothetical protein